MPSLSRKTAIIRRMYTATLRRELGWYPTWPAGSVIALGDIGTYDRKKKAFSWKTDLKTLGISIDPVVGSTADELFSSHTGTAVDFRVDAGYGLAEFSFQKSGAVVTQTVGLGTQELSAKSLAQHLVEAVDNDRVKWDFDWRVVTRLFTADTATILVNRRWSAGISLGTQVPVTVGGFNIADANLKITPRAHRGRVWQRVAKGTPTPWFETHYLQNVKGKVLIHEG